MTTKYGSKKMKNTGLLSYFFLIIFLLSLSAVQAEEEEFLRPEQAFVLNHSQLKTDKDNQYYIQAKWKIADDYYMYKNKVSFYTENKEIKLGNPVLPAGIMKNDEFLGKTDVYKKHLEIKIPISLTIAELQTTAQDKAQIVTITAKTQGCAEAGICYPPFRQVIKFSLPLQQETHVKQVKQKTIAAPESIFSDFAAKTKSSLSAVLNNQEDEFLKPEDAFILDIETTDKGKIIATWNIEKGYYLFKDKFKFETIPADASLIGAINFPKAKQKSDEYLGDYEVYENQVSIQVPLQAEPEQIKSIIAKKMDLKIQYQGCAESGICYPLQKKIIPIDSSRIQFNNANTTEPLASTSSKNNPIQLSEQDALANYLSKGNNILILLTFFGLGLALAFTPCVFPMIPILSGIIAGQSEEVNARKAFMISVVYVLAMAVTYTIIGVFAGLSGENIQIWFQNPWVLSAFALVFVLLALSMFGFYELQLPSSLQSKIAEISNKQKGGNYTGVIIMGFLSALIVGPCVAPPLMGALIYISQTGDPFLGGAALFFMSLGMGLPLIIVGTSAGKFLPRAGVWMDAVKAAFGVMMLAVAIWMLERILPGVVSMWLWAILLIFSAVYIGALTPIHDNTTGWERFWKSLGIVMLIYGTILIFAASAGYTDVMQPLKGLTSVSKATTSGENSQHLNFKKVVSPDQLNKELRQAKQDGKNVLLDYYADWCISCIELEKYTFTDPEVIKQLDGFILLQADVTKDNEDSNQLLKQYQLIGPPAIMFFKPSGQEIKHFRLVGYKNATQFIEHIKRFKENK
jgi:thioredoxin:protein disulfide reductase